MKYLLNILFTAIISVSILPLQILGDTGTGGYHSHDGYMQCHCNILKAQKDDGKISYIIDCSSDDKHITSGAAQLRTAVLQGNLINNSTFIKISYLSFTSKIPERTLTTDTPPPKTV